MHSQRNLFSLINHSLKLFSLSQISQQLDVISQLERDLSESSRALENARETAAEDVSADGEKLLLNNNTYFKD